MLEKDNGLVYGLPATIVTINMNTLSEIAN